MDAYERTLFNCRLGTQNPNGLKQYFFPLANGYWRAYNSPEDSFWCCTGTGAEEFAKFTDTIYSHSQNDILVNQFIASTLDWKEESFGLRQETAFPAEQQTTLVITAAPAHAKTIYLRIPGWISAGGKVEINGREIEAFAEPSSYLALRKVWRAGDRILLTLPMQLAVEPLPGAAQTQAVLYGPLVLAADLGPGPKEGPAKIIHGRGTVPEGAPPPSPNPQVHAASSTDASARPDWVEVESPSELRFRTVGLSENLRVQPMYRITDQRYAVYWDAVSKS
jgi:hypothetical protein